MTISLCILALEDFQAVDAAFEFLAGQTEVVVSIPVIDDVFPEETEQFEVILTASPGVFVDSPASAIVSILNDDPDLPGKAPSSLEHESLHHLIVVMNVSFASVSIDVVEGAGVISLELLKTAGALGPVSVQISAQDGTALGIIIDV